MFPCGICNEKFFSYDNVRDHLEGHKSQMLKESEIKSEPVFDQDFDEGILMLDCVKEEEQLQGQQEETQNGEDPSESGEKCTIRERKSSSETFRCSDCSYKTINKAYFKNHMNVMHLNKIKCDQCPKRFSSEGRLKHHIQEKHEEGDKPKLLEDEFFLMNENKAQGKRKWLLECLYCTFKAHDRHHIYRHIRGVHRNLLEELYKSKGMALGDSGYHKCTKCDFKTLNMFNLKQHIKAVHQKTRDFVCDLCKQAFSTKKTILRHMKSIHISAESSILHKCLLCPYKTVSKYNLTVHVNMVHLKIREFTCDTCQQQFSKRLILQRHIDNVHLKRKKMFNCEHDKKCLFRTMEKIELLRHIRRDHQKINGFSCELCGKWYSHHSSLSKHRKKLHLTKEPSTTMRQS